MLWHKGNGAILDDTAHNGTQPWYWEKEIACRPRQRDNSYCRNNVLPDLNLNLPYSPLSSFDGDKTVKTAGSKVVSHQTGRLKSL